MKRMVLSVVFFAAGFAACVNAALVGSWSFSEGAGQWASNNVVGGVNLRLGSSDSTWADPAWVANGYSGGGLFFSNPGGGATPDYLRPTGTADLSAFNTNTFTIGARINLNSIPDDTFDTSNPYRIFSFAGTDGGVKKASYFLRVTGRADGTGMLSGYFFDESGAGYSVIHSAVMTTGVWYHVGFSHDGSAETDNTTLWVDGVEKTVTHAGSPRTDLVIDGNSLVVGAQSLAQARGFDGRMDDVVFYDTVTSISEPVSLSVGTIDLEVSGTNAIVNWQGDVAGIYALQSRQTLFGAWSNAIEDIAGTNGIMSVTNGALAEQEFYRIVVE